MKEEKKKQVLDAEERDHNSLVNSMRYSVMEEPGLSASQIKEQLKYLKDTYHISLSRVMMKALQYGILNSPEFEEARPGIPHVR